MELGSYFLFLQEQIKDIIIISVGPQLLVANYASADVGFPLQGYADQWRFWHLSLTTTAQVYMAVGSFLFL
jgi:hypothetical protein